MPRRKRHTIKAQDLDICKALVRELSAKDELADFDMATIEISILKNKADPKIQDPEKAVKNLERYIAINGDKDVLKSKLFKIMKVSRPTLDKWIGDELLKPTYTKGQFDYWKYFNLKDVVSQLKKDTK